MEKKLSFLSLTLLALSCLVSCATGGPSTASTSLEPSSSDDSSYSSVSAESAQSDDSSSSQQTPKKDFTGIVFSDASFVYDGLAHSVYVVGAPDFANVTYEGNERINAGSYTVKAHIEAENYNPMDLRAMLTIGKATLENVTFEGRTFEYDGQAHSLYVEGAPDEATVTYTNNGKTSVGTYTVTAKITAPNYNPLTKTAVLRILGKNIEGIAFNDQTFIYDGGKHSLEISGELPSGVSASYTNNGKTDAGTYEVTARLTGEGYEPLELKAKLTIKPAEVKKPGYFHDACFLYDGKPHSISVSDAPSYATVTYRCLNAKGTNAFVDPGQYVIEATVKVSNNEQSVLKATLLIMEEGSIGVDETKTLLSIDENLKWDDLHEALGKGNYSYDYFSGSYDVDSLDDPRPSDLLEESCPTHQTRTHFATDGKEAYGKTLSTYDEPYYSYSFYQEVGEDIFYARFSDDDADVTVGKTPKASFRETVCLEMAANAFVALSKGKEGEFLVGVDGDDYYEDVGYPFIQDGRFIVLMEHPRTLDDGYRYFYEIYEFFNIGNSKVTLPSANAPSGDFMENEVPIGDCRMGGVKYCWASYGSYSHLVRYYSVQLYVSYNTAVFLKPGTYTVLPLIYDEPVRAIVHYSYYNRYYNYDQTGYAFNLYIDEEGDYQGEYAELGSVERLSLRDFVSCGGVVNYYADWHE